MWEDLILKAKNGGLDVIDTYVFWDVHEPSPDNVSSVFFIFLLISFNKYLYHTHIYVLLHI